MDHRFRGPKSKKFAMSAARFLAETGGKKQRPQKLALISFDPILTKFLREHLLAVEHKNSLWIQGSYGMGPASITFQAEILAAQGLETIITLGTAGAIGSYLEIARTVVIERALVDEGVSSHYGVDGGDWSAADPALVAQFARHYSAISSWTTETPFRESAEEISHASALGIQAVEMEASALYSAARELGLKALALAVISDRVLPGAWEPHLQAPQVRTALEKTADQVLQLLCSPLMAN